MPRTKTNKELRVACDSCKARAGQPCVSKLDGRKLDRWVHPKRQREAKRDWRRGVYLG